MSQDGSKRMVLLPDLVGWELGDTQIKERWVPADYYSEIPARQAKQDSASSRSHCTFPYQIPVPEEDENM